MLFGNRNNTAHRLLFLLNAAAEPCDFSVPAAGPGSAWACRFDTARAHDGIRAVDVSQAYPLLAHSAVLLEC